MIGKVIITEVGSELIGTYRHFKGGEYQVLLTAADANSMAEIVVYKSLSTRCNFCRTREEFDATVIYNGVYVKRFERVLSGE